ncbi:peptide-methionine (R)-S-oxide reductase [Sphingomonas palmae]|uniref:peptide-methionine (R)-S-oxide reductase n=2 Tax=Sphingomonas palmae TaxID=1855283 RepID=A0A1H7TF54_9SPHN|nr:peptide-methionine (R)-S-oxide reductase [Sphingomonas palmae]
MTTYISCMTYQPVDRRRFLALTGMGAAATTLMACGARSAAAAEHFPVTKTDAQWRAQLGPAAYQVLREEGTERPYSSPLNNEHRAGVFACKGCAHPLYSSRTKFESGTGWPSFWAPLKGAVATRRDSTLGMVRTEVHCPRCGGHLGHVFDDGPKPTGLRYCMNGVAMTFRPA